MAGRLLIDALGATVVLDLTGLSASDAEAVRRAWRDAVAPDPAAVESAPVPEPVEGSPPLVIRVREPGDTSDTARLLERLSQRVTLAAVTARRGELWMLHAAGLALPDGRVVALIGPSGRGKTTASRIVGRELGYVTDETVAIDAGGRVWPYRKPLSIIEGGVYPKAERAPSDAGLGPLPDAPLRLAAIVLLDRREDAGDAPVVEPVDLGDALDELVSQSSYLASLAEPLRLMAALTSRVGGVRRVIYREAESLAPVLRTVAEAGSDVPPQSPAPPRPDPSPGEVGADQPAWFRGAAHDVVALADPDRIAVLQVDADESGILRVLAGIAPALWRAAAGASREDLVAAAVATYGAPEGQDAAPAVDAALAELSAVGLLAWRAGRWAVRDDVAWTGADGRYVVVSLDRDGVVPLALEGSAAVIWEALSAGGSTDEVTERVAALAGVEPDTVRADVASFLDELRDAGILTLA